MTAVSTRPLSSSTDALLRFALRADATQTGFAGLLGAAFADPLATLTGLSPTTEYFLGAAFVAYGLVVFWLAALPSLRGVGIAICIANLSATVATLLIVPADAGPLTEGRHRRHPGHRRLHRVLRLRAVPGCASPAALSRLSSATACAASND